MKHNVAILGASHDPSRYSYKAFKLLQEYGHTPLPVNPSLPKLEEIKVFGSLSEIEVPVHTLTMYVGAQRSSPLQDQILKLKPQRVIFNPGSENPELERAIQKSGIEVVHGCTLVMLKTRQF
jgi:uncharacterized protein